MATDNASRTAAVKQDYFSTGHWLPPGAWNSTSSNWSTDLYRTKSLPCVKGALDAVAPVLQNEFTREVHIMFLYRPVGKAEYELIAQSDFTAYPPRLPEQTPFSLVLT